MSAKGIAKPKSKVMSQSEVISALTVLTEADKKDVKAIMLALKELIPGQLKIKKQFCLHGCGKLVLKKRKARKAGMGRNPFTGEPCKIKARPAAMIPRGRPLKALKEHIA